MSGRSLEIIVLAMAYLPFVRLLIWLNLLIKPQFLDGTNSASLLFYFLAIAHLPFIICASASLLLVDGPAGPRWIVVVGIFISLFVLIEIVFFVNPGLEGFLYQFLVFAVWLVLTLKLLSP